MGSIGDPVPRWDSFGNVTSASDVTSQITASAAWLAQQPVEHFHVIFIDRARNFIASETMWTGNEIEVAVFPREVVRRAIVLRAHWLIAMHNHPVGEALPSSSDNKMTLELEEISHRVGFILWDHLIVGKSSMFSMRDHNKMGRWSGGGFTVRPKDFARYALACTAARSRLQAPLANLLSGSAWQILLALYRDARAMTSREIALMVAASPTSVVRYLAALEEEGLVTGLSDQVHGRSRRSKISDRGAELVEELIGAVA